MAWLADPSSWMALLTLTILEIVLGVDNIIFITILVSRLPEGQQKRARVIGLSLAMGMRIVLLLSITWVMSLTRPLFSLWTLEFSGRDLILIFGGLFLLVKSTLEIHGSLEGKSPEARPMARAGFLNILAQIALLDMIFSLDSVITAVGLAKEVTVMIVAIVIAILVMMASAAAIGDFVDRHPTIKMLALSFLILIGVTLLGEGLHFHIPKGYVYFAMAFSFGVEMLNLKIRGHAAEPVRLKKPLTKTP
ncbi:MAG: TerC family protein [Desulfobacterales bacterium]|jgi:predicted tellurium resistance membrane protein TerC